MNQNASYIVETLDIIFMTETLMTLFQKFCNDGCKEGNPECAIHMIFLRSFPPEVRGRGCQHLPGQESPSLHVRHPAPGDLLHGGGQGPVLAPQVEPPQQVEQAVQPGGVGHGRVGAG